MKTKELDNYIVHEDGKVWSKRRSRFLKPSKNNAGYYQLNIDGKFIKVHRLVYQCFKGVIPDDLEVDHIDGNKENNHTSNLQLLTHAENIQKTYNQGRKAPKGKEHWNYNKKAPPSTLAKMSKAKQGVKHPKFKGFYIIDGIKYTSARQAGISIGVPSNTIIRRCKNNKHPNYIFNPAPNPQDHR